MKKNLKTIFKIMLIMLLISLVALLSSCNVQKAFNKDKSNSSYSEDIETKSFRKGDTVHYEIPKVTFKDTIIYRKNIQGTTIRTVYNKEGNITSIDCFASAIEEFKKENRDFKEAFLRKDKQKTEKFDDSFVIYIMLGIVIIFCFALFLMFLYVKKNTASILNIIDTLK